MLIKTLNYNTPPCCGQITLSNFDEICPLATPNQIFTISMHTPSLVKIYCIYSSYHPETKIWGCLGQITPLKFDEICPLAILNQIFTISMHIPSLVKNPLIFTQAIIRKPKYGRIWKITLKIDEICPLAVPNQTSSISMHIPSLVKIH